MDGFSFLLFFALIGIAIFGLWLASLIHCIANKDLSDANRIIYVVVIILLGPLGTMIYFLMLWE